MQNKGIYTDISQNAIAIRAKSARNSLQHIQKRRRGSTPTKSRTPEPIDRKQSAAEDPARTVSRYHAAVDRNSQTGADTDRPISARTDTALSDRSSRAKSCTVNPVPTDTDRNRNRPTNRADRISPNRSRQTGAACHGQPVPDFSRLSGQGS